ncbi:MAG TPA: hypothetical protein V6D17_13350 [Candidatus Obscuribacterales bacterium]
MNYKKVKHLGLPLSLALILASAVLANSAWGQQWGASDPFKPHQKNRPTAKKHSSVHNLTKVTKVPDLPDLPNYTGKSKFIGGSFEEAARGGPIYSLNFNAEETESQVLDWYANVFRMYKWKVSSRMDTSIRAVHQDGHTCSVSTSSPLQPDGKSRSGFNVVYQIVSR